MPVLTPKQVGLYMMDCAFFPSGFQSGVQTYDDGSVKVVDENAKARAVKWLDTMLAVCKAESGFDTNIKNPGSNARGLWQIMTSVHGDKIKRAQAYWMSELGLEKVPTIFEPHVNTTVAKEVYNSQGIRAWEAYNTGAYKRHLGYGEEVFKYLFFNPEMNQQRIRKLTEEIALGKATAQFAGIAVPGGVAITGGANAVEWADNMLKDIVPKAGVFILGIVLLILGAWFLLSQTKAGTTVKSVAKKASPIG